MECYLDNSATTRPCKEAVAAAMAAMTDGFGNPSSLHRYGFEALQVLEAARHTVAKSLSCEDSEVFFTPNGTLANNTAIFGAVAQNRRRGQKIVTTAMEHPSVSQCMTALETQGFEVVRLLPDTAGQIPVEQFANAVDADTILVSLMAVNNEVGSVLPFDALSRVLRAKSSPALLHVDAVQAYLKLPVVPKKCGIDLMSISAHKVHGLKGAGALYVRKGVHIKPHVLGGGQEEGLCSGTQAMPAIAAFAAAVAAHGDTAAHLETVTRLRNQLCARLCEIDGVLINSPENALPYILNASLAGIPAQVSVNFLSMQGVYVSAGSACAKGHRSPVLTAMQLSPERVDSAVRFSLSHKTTEEEIELCVSAVQAACAQLRKRGK